MTQKDKMFLTVIKNLKLQENYDYDPSDFESLEDGLDADNTVVCAIAKIIKELNGSDDPSEQKRVYKTVFTYLNNNLLA